MDATHARPVRLGCFDVGNGSAAIADQALPIAVEVDSASGRVAGVHIWPILASRRDRPVAQDILILGDAIMIASPAAGGVVRISRSSGAVTVIPLDAEPGTLTACGDAVWVVAQPDWAHAGEEDEGEDEPRGPATPVWCIRDGAARRVDTDLESPGLAAIGGRIVAACRLPDDPVIKHISGSGVSYGYPGTIVVIEEDGQLRPLGPVASLGGVICEDGDRVWLLGFDQEIGDQDDPGPRELLLAECRITASLNMRLHEPVGVVGGLVADLWWKSGAGGPGVPRTEPSLVARFLPVDGGDPVQINVPGGHHYLAKVRDGQLWVGMPGGAALTVVTPDRPSVRELAVTIDLRPLISPPQLPSGLDTRQFECDQLHRFRAEYRSGWRDEAGLVTPLIKGVSFDSIELHGQFPAAQIVALFSAADYPGIQFGRRRDLYDELGNPIRHNWPGVYLMEDFSCEIPPLPEADTAGVVWI